MKTENCNCNKCGAPIRFIDLDCGACDYCGVQFRLVKEDDVGGFGLSGMTDASNMFKNCTSLTAIPVFIFN